MNLVEVNLNNRVNRGGSCNTDSYFVRASVVVDDPPQRPRSDVGVRLVRKLGSLVRKVGHFK